WPLFQYDRLRHCNPFQSTRWNRTIRPADILAQRNEIIVSAERVAEPKGAPHLPKARVDIHEYPPPRLVEDLTIIKVAHHVQQELRRAHFVQHLPARLPDHPLAAVVEQRELLTEAEFLHHPQEIAEVDGAFKWRRLPRFIHAHLRGQT